MSEKKGEREVIDLESFIALWQIMAKRAYKTIDISFNNYLLQVQFFTEHFFLSHLQLTHDQLQEFGYIDDYKNALQLIKMSDSLESILYIGANFVFNQKEGLMKQAYEESLELYMKYSKDSEVIKKAVKAKYEKQQEVYAQKILESVPDEVYAKRAIAISRSFKGFTKNEKKYLKYGLVTKKGLDESIVFDMQNLFESYIAMNTNIKVNDNG